MKKSVMVLMMAVMLGCGLAFGDVGVPQSSPYTSDANTTLLVHFDGTTGALAAGGDTRVDGVKGASSTTVTGTVGTVPSGTGYGSIMSGGVYGQSYSGGGVGTGGLVSYPQTSYNVMAGTIEMWVKTPSDWVPTGYNGYLFSEQNVGNHIIFVNGGELYSEFRDRNWNIKYRTANITSWGPNEWHHVAVAWHQTDVSGFRTVDTMNIYLDGVLHNDYSYHMEDNNYRYSSEFGANISIGGSLVYGGTAWLGQIDEVRLYDQPLTFTPPAPITTVSVPQAAPYTSDGYTSLLLHLDGATGDLSVPSDSRINGLKGFFANGNSVTGTVGTVPDGTVYGSIMSEGEYGQSYYGGGVIIGGLLSYPLSTYNPMSGTIDMWVKTPSNPEPTAWFGYLFSEQGSSGNHIIYVQGGGLLCVFRDRNWNSKYREALVTSWGPNEWHHVAVAWHQTDTDIRTVDTLNIYLDGVLHNDYEYNMAANNFRYSTEFGDNISIGGSLVYAGTAWPGQIDEVRIYQTLIAFTAAPPVATPTFSLAGGLYASAQTVTVSCTTPGATIYYTDNNTTPSPSNGTPIVSGGTVSVDHSLTLKAKAWASGYNPSAVASVVYVIPTSYDRPTDIFPVDHITVDGDLSDWAGSTWAELDQVYDGTPSDIPEAYYAAKWSTNTVYVAVKVRDNSTHVFTDDFSSWNGRDAVEIYLHTTGTSSDYTYPNCEPAQQLTLGIMNSNRSAVWSSLGNNLGIPITEYDYEAAGKEGTGGWLYYEARLTPYQYMGGLVFNTSVISPLSDGQIIGLDVTAVGNDGSYTGMKAENTKTGKSENYWQFGLHRLRLYTASDLAAMLTAMDSKSGDGNYNPASDLDGDGEITSTDLSILLANMQP